MKTKRILTLILLSASASAAVCLSSCRRDELPGYVDDMRQSAALACAVNETITVTDGGTTVYGYTRAVSVSSSDTVTVTVTESKLGSAFAMETTTSTEVYENADRNSLISINLNENLVVGYEIADGDLSCTVTAENLATVLGRDDLNAAGEAKMYFDFEEGKLVALSCVYTTQTSKTVTVNVSYGYEE